MRKKHGFTLVELLVVIAIIALLVALLVAGLGGVKESARISQCQSLLAGIAKANNSYGVNNDDRIPDPDTWPQDLAQYLGTKVREDDAGTLREISKARVLLCPTNYRNHKKEADEDNLVAFSRNNMFAPKNTLSATPRVSDFEVPSKAVLALDGIFDSSSWKRNITDLTGYSAKDEPGYLHGKDKDRLTVVFLDGHAQNLEAPQVPKSPYATANHNDEAWSGSLFWRGYLAP